MTKSVYFRVRYGKQARIGPDITKMFSVHSILTPDQVEIVFNIVGDPKCNSFGSR